MSADINIFTVTGRLTRESELKQTPNGAYHCDFSLAYTRSVKKGDNWEDKSCFIECILWGKQGEILSQYLTKGQQVCVSGGLDHQRWEHDGQKRSMHKLIVSDIRLMGSSSKSQTTEETSTEVEDDIPF